METAAGSQALGLAAFHGHRDAVRVLLRQGGDVHGRDGKGYNPLMLAASQGHAEVVEELIQAGSRLLLRTHYSLFIAHMSVYGNNH